MPSHLLVAIFQEALKTYRLESGGYRTLQMVCKSWRDALLELSAEVDSALVSIPDPADLSLMCKMLPGVSWLCCDSRRQDPLAFRESPVSTVSTVEDVLEKLGSSTWEACN